MSDKRQFLDEIGLGRLCELLMGSTAKRDLRNVNPSTGRKNLGILNPDLNQNDPEAVDFVKNRTHWIEDLIVPYAQYAVDATYHRAIIEQGGLRAGENYTVTWEGQQYVCTATYQNVLYTVLGDDGVVPFKIQSSSSRMYIYPTDTTLTAVNMGIKGPGAYHPLSENFLPVVPVSKGGTGAKTVAAAQEALGIGGKRTTRLTIGTSTSGWATKDCDYLCDGEADDVEINAAIDALPEDGGEIVLLDGSYYLKDDIDLGTAGVTIRGNGQATKLVRAAEGINILYIRYPGCTVENLYLDGQNVDGCGIYLSSNNNIIRGCTIKGNTSYGIQCWGAHNKISENTISNSYTGINVLDDYNVVSNNVVLSNSEHGISVQGDHNIVAGNISRLNAVANLRLMSANYCAVVGNDCSIAADDEVTAQYAIQLYRTDNSYNIVTENLVGNGSITDDGGTVNITGYAPTGFGYGDIPVHLGSAADDAAFLVKLNEQFAKIDGRTQQVTFTRNGNAWVGTLWSAGNNYGALTAYCYNGDNSAQLSKLVRNCKNGTWEDWEFENPPMINNTEYRTTERYLGKPVYTKLISLGSLPNNTTKTVDVGLTINHLVSLVVEAYDSSGNKYVLPYIGDDTSVRCFAYVAGTNIKVCSPYHDSSNLTGLALIKYTKD